MEVRKAGIENDYIEMPKAVSDIIAQAIYSLEKDLKIGYKQAEKILLEQAIGNYARVWAENNDKRLLKRLLGEEYD